MQKALFSKLRNVYFLLESDWKIHNYCGDNEEVHVCYFMPNYGKSFGKIIEIISLEIMKKSKRLQPCVVIKLVVD